MLRNTQLRKNVAHATDVIQAKRDRLVAEKTDWQELRTAAAAIRTHALDNLDTYLSNSKPLHRRRRNGPLGRDAAEARASFLIFCAKRRPARSSRSRP